MQYRSRILADLDKTVPPPLQIIICQYLFLGFKLRDFGVCENVRGIHDMYYSSSQLYIYLVTPAGLSPPTPVAELTLNTTSLATAWIVTRWGLLRSLEVALPPPDILEDSFWEGKYPPREVVRCPMDLYTQNLVASLGEKHSFALFAESQVKTQVLTLYSQRSQERLRFTLTPLSSQSRFALWSSTQGIHITVLYLSSGFCLRALEIQVQDFE